MKYLKLYLKNFNKFGFFILIITPFQHLNCQLLLNEGAHSMNRELFMMVDSSFCPDSLMISQMNSLKECCCFRDINCSNLISSEGLKVIKTGHFMSIIKNEIIKGSCWDFVNKVYNNSGFPSSKRKTIYKGKKNESSVDLTKLQSGDWIYHVNYSYHNVSHSAIFICWKDFDKKIGITLSYVGQNRLKPGRYGTFDLSGVYNIIRAIDK